MVKIATLLAILLSFLTLTAYPWVSPVLYSVFSILQPQYVWFWAFDGIPAFKIFAGLALLSWIIQAAKGTISYEIYKLPINKALMLLTFLINLSHWLASYPGGVAAEIMQELFNIIMLMYFICIGLVANERAIKYICYGFILTGVYYGYDSNMAYFDMDWSRFQSGRLSGPSRGAYSDNNKFAILMVACFPFLLLGFFHFKSVWLKGLMVFGMAMIMHGIFLTGSRGGLLAVGAAVFFCTRSIKSKALNVVLLAGFVFVVLDQAGNVLGRSESVVTQTRTESEKPVNPRILSWSVGKDLIISNPLFGVGLHRFRIASMIEYPGKSPHVAHNTFITFAAGSGLACGIIYLFLFYKAYQMLKEIRKMPSRSNYRYYAESAFAGLMGFFTGAIFLDMIVFEPFYYLLMIITACYFSLVPKDINTVNEFTEARHV